jgi:protein phosphatase 1 regulatory subunit 37
VLTAAALKLNSGLRELYLADNNLGVADAIQLGGLLRTNFTLQLLDIRSVHYITKVNLSAMLL